MELVKNFKKEGKRTLQELHHDWLQAGIFLDSMTTSNISKNTKTINYYLEKFIDRSVTFIQFLDENIKKRKVENTIIKEIILFFKETTGKVEKFRRKVNKLIPTLQKKEIEIPGERKKIEDQKNFLSARQELKDNYTKIDYLLEKESLKEDIKKLEKIFSSEHVEEKINIKSLTDKLQRVSRVILYNSGDSFSTLDKRNTLAQVDLRIKSLGNLSKKMTDQNSIQDIEEEIESWKYLRKDLKNVSSETYPVVKSQLLKLIDSDNKLFERIEAA